MIREITQQIIIILALYFTGILFHAFIVWDIPRFNVSDWNDTARFIFGVFYFACAFATFYNDFYLLGKPEDS